jgi:hypothetical protein
MRQVLCCGQFPQKFADQKTPKLGISLQATPMLIWPVGLPAEVCIDNNSFLQKMFRFSSFVLLQRRVPSLDLGHAFTFRVL